VIVFGFRIMFVNALVVMIKDFGIRPEDMFVQNIILRRINVLLIIVERVMDANHLILLH